MNTMRTRFKEHNNFSYRDLLRAVRTYEPSHFEVVDDTRIVIRDSTPNNYADLISYLQKNGNLDRLKLYQPNSFFRSRRKGIAAVARVNCDGSLFDIVFYRN